MTNILAICVLRQCIGRTKEYRSGNYIYLVYTVYGPEVQQLHQLWELMTGFLKHMENGNQRNVWKKIYGPFLWMGFNCLNATETLEGGSLLFTTKFPESPGDPLIDFRSTSEGWKVESTLEPPSGFEYGTPGLGIQHLNH